MLAKPAAGKANENLLVVSKCLNVRWPDIRFRPTALAGSMVSGPAGGKRSKKRNRQADSWA